MSWFDHQEKLTDGGEGKSKDPNTLKSYEIKMPGGTDYIKVNKNCVKRVYDDDLGGPIVIIIDEAAELLQPSGVKSEEGKEEDGLKTEIEMIIQSITQLGRSAGIHCFICTQRNGTKIINGTIQNNCLSIDTEVELREIT